MARGSTKFETLPTFVNRTPTTKNDYMIDDLAQSPDNCYIILKPLVKQKQIQEVERVQNFEGKQCCCEVLMQQIFAWGNL